MVAGKLEMEFETVPTMCTLVASAVESIVPLAQKRDIRLEVELAEDAAPVRIDAERMQQVIWNLLSNALKFTPAGGTVRTRCGVRDGRLELQVIDSGRGITREFLPHVFERFAQESKTRARNGLGLGLGLAISRYIVESHAGTIAAFSEGEGTGTTITVSLPVVAAQQAAAT
jgi:signal transduction histidine kinase